MTYALLILALVYLTFIHYAAVMNLVRVKDANKLTRLQVPVAYVALAFGLVLDVLLNVLACLLVLWVIPRDWLLTSTLIRFKRAGSGMTRITRWRYAVACWVCAELLDTLDPHPSGCHCRID